MSSPTFILIPGSWHTATHLEPLLTILQKQGHKAKASQLHSVGRKTPRPTFADDVNVIYTAVSEDLQEGKDVCLVVHSFAGMSGAEAVNKLIANGALEPREGKGKLIRVIFIAAYAFPAGFILDAKDFIRPEDPGFSIDDESMSHMAKPEHFFYNDLSTSEAQKWIDALDDAYYLGRDVVISSEDWRKAPVTALLCERDNSVPFDRQEMVWQGMEQESIDAGHVPFVSRPEEVAEVLVRLAGAQR